MIAWGKPAGAGPGATSALGGEKVAMDRRFEYLLLQYAQESRPEGRQRLHDTLWEEFGSKKAVLVMDMSGFSLLTQRFGIVHYLSMVRRMQLTAQPAIEKEGGQVIKFEADNCFAAFADASAALRAAVALNTVVATLNVCTEDAFDIRVSIGIDYGDVLMIGGPDYSGGAVNRASKIGEDIAGPGEILITEEAYRSLPEGAGFRGRALSVSCSGIETNVISIEY